MIAVKADVADLSGRNQSQYAVYHAEACAQDRDDGQLFAGDHRGHAFFNGSGDRNILHRQIAQRFISHESGDFFDQLAEFIGPRMDIAQHGYLMLNQRMV